MTTETQVVRETFHFAPREPRSVAVATLRETARFNDRMVVTPGIVVRETLLINDHVVQSAYSVLHETFRARDAVHPVLKYSVDTRDQFFIDDAISSQNRVHVDVREQAHFLSRAVAPPNASLHETFRVRDAVHWFSSGTVALRETFRIRDAAYPHSSVVLRDTFYADDALSSALRAVVNVREVLHIDDAAWPQNFVRGDGTTLRETFYADDRAHATLRGAGGPPLHETFYVDDRALPPASGRAFTCHIVNWGMSTYLNYPFQTQAHNYAAGQNLWRLDATQDYNKPVLAWITTGKIDVGTAHGKRPTVFYAAGSTLEPLTVTVTADVNGKLASFDYLLELRDQTDYRNNRAPLGKGFRSRYFQFKLQAGKYTGFRILTAEVDLAASPRRVG